MPDGCARLLTLLVTRFSFLVCSGRIVSVCPLQPAGKRSTWVFLSPVLLYSECRLPLACSRSPLWEPLSRLLLRTIALVWPSIQVYLAGHIQSTFPSAFRFCICVSVFLRASGRPSGCLLVQGWWCLRFVLSSKAERPHSISLPQVSPCGLTLVGSADGYNLFFLTTRQDATVNAGAGKSTLSQARRAKAGGVAADLKNPKSITAPLYR